MRYWVTWSWRANDMIKGILSDEIEIPEQITSVDVVKESVKFHVGEPYAHEVDTILAWSNLEEI